MGKMFVDYKTNLDLHRKITEQSHNYIEDWLLNEYPPNNHAVT